MSLENYTLEERLTEPFRSIRWFVISPLRRWGSAMGIVSFLALWYLARDFIFYCWFSVLQKLINTLILPWNLNLKPWPDLSHAWTFLPILALPLETPGKKSLLIFTGISLFLWWITGRWKDRGLPLRTGIRFLMFPLFMTILWCGFLNPRLVHSVDDWSQLYFLVSYGSVFILSFIWMFGVLWFPIPLFYKILMSWVWIVYLFFGVPLLFFTAVFILGHTSLLLLPTLALGVVPILQLGWFISFYSIALSKGVLPS